MHNGRWTIPHVWTSPSAFLWFTQKDPFLTILGSLHDTGPPQLLRRYLFTSISSAFWTRNCRRLQTSPDCDSRNDAIPHRPVTLNTVLYPGGPQGRPDHLWQKECQAHVEQLRHGFPWSRITNGPWNTENVQTGHLPPQRWVVALPQNNSCHSTHMCPIGTAAIWLFCL